MVTNSGGNGTIGVFQDSRGHLLICEINDRKVGSFGIFYGDIPFNFVLPASICQLFIIVLTTRLLYFLLRPLRTPKFICNILGGIVLGPSFLGRNKTLIGALFPERQAQFLVLTSLLGISYFTFLVGLKMDILLTFRAAKSTWRLGVIPFLTSFVVLVTLIYHFYEPQNLPLSRLQITRIWLSASMSITNFPVMSEALYELNLITTELGHIALSSSMINDNVHWSFILVNRMMSAHNTKVAISYFISTILFLIFTIFVLRPTLKLIVHKTPVGKPVKEIYVVFILLGVLVMAVVGDIVSVSFVLGPLLYGMVMPSGPPLATTLVDKSEVMITEFLLPSFFMAIGIKTNLFVLRDWSKFLTLQGIFLAGDLAKMVACVLVSLTYNIKPRNGTILGLMLNFKGITQLISIVRMTELKLADEETFCHVVVSVVITTAISAPLVKLLYKHSPRVLNESSILHEGEMLTIQSTLRNSELRIITCLHNEGNVPSIRALLEACNPMLESPLCVYVIHLVELLGKSTPSLIPIKYSHNRKLFSVNYPNTNNIISAFENYSRNSSGPITIIPFVNVAPYKNMYSAVCDLSHDKMASLIIIPFHENDNIDLDDHVLSSIRKVNATFQAHVPCTLGILADRFSRLGGSKDPHSKLYFNMGIFFIGGPDDREALSLGIRMSRRSSTKLSLFRFIVMNKKPHRSIRRLEEEDYVEEMLDEGLIDEYKATRFSGGNVSWYDITVEDAVGVLDAIRNLEGSYDLVMVGRRHNIGCFNDVEMSPFLENAQVLGVLGDMLSSTEFCIGQVPVLVLQCGGDKVSKLNRVCSVSTVSQTILLE